MHILTPAYVCFKTISIVLTCGYMLSFVKVEPEAMRVAIIHTRSDIRISKRVRAFLMGSQNMLSCMCLFCNDKGALFPSYF